MAGYYPSFDCVIVAADGHRYPARSVTLDAHNVTQSASLGTLTADADGYVAEGSFGGGAAVLDVVEFSVSGYAGRFRVTLQATQAEAYAAAENFVNSFVLENLFAATEESRDGYLYAFDLDDPAKPPINLGKAKAGETVVVPYQTTKQQRLSLRLVSQDVKGQRSVSALEDAVSTTVTVPAPAGVKFETLFDDYADRTTTGTAQETLHSYAMPTGVLDHAGDKIVAEYAGAFAANGNSKRVVLSFAGADIFDSGALTENGGGWHLRATVMAASGSAVRTVCNFASAAHHPPAVSEVSGLDLAAAGYDLDLEAVTGASAGDATLKLAHGQLIPRVPQTDFGGEWRPFSLAWHPGEIEADVDEAQLGALQLVWAAPQLYITLYEPPIGPGGPGGVDPLPAD